ncbi:MAG: DUF448 domain-containing protein [Proteobacteria bacterium]|nr:DUF448 domain-containing protein [Pseudomonadota bacterium]
MARRTCVACREEADRDGDDLIRLVRSPDGRAIVDLRGKLPGRGAWVHAKASCLSRVEKRPGALRLGGPVVVEGLSESVQKLVVAAALDGLSMAQAAGAVIGGAQQLESALQKGMIHSVIVASDAADRTVAKLREAAEERVAFVTLPLSTDELGPRIGRGPRAAVGVTSSRAGVHLRRQLRRLADLG